MHLAEKLQYFHGWRKDIFSVVGFSQDNRYLITSDDSICANDAGSSLYWFNLGAVTIQRLFRFVVTEIVTRR